MNTIFDMEHPDNSTLQEMKLDTEEKGNPEGIKVLDSTPVEEFDEFEEFEDLEQPEAEVEFEELS
jgi:hypothetical protein